MLYIYPGMDKGDDEEVWYSLSGGRGNTVLGYNIKTTCYLGVKYGDPSPGYQARRLYIYKNISIILERKRYEASCDGWV